MKDSIEEIADVMNLILPLDNQMPTGDDFISTFFTKKDSFNILKPESIYKLKQYFKGRISYLKSNQSQNDVKKIFVGESMAGLEYYKVYPDYMGEHQNASYVRTFRDAKNIDDQIPAGDNKKNSVYNDSRQAALFVFPDGTFGSVGFDKYVIKKTTRKRLTFAGDNDKFETITTYHLEENFKKQIKNKDINVMFENINYFSSKFATTIKNILDAYKEGKLSFVFSSLVYGSGAVLFGLILELFGFSSAQGNETTEALRYAIVNSESGNLKKLTESFNKRENRYGKYITVLIGSTVIAEGFTLKNIQEEHILTPHWNYSETDQVIARGYRVGSHQHLIDDGVVPVLRVYQHASIPMSKDVESIDIKLYKTSEIKDVNIKHIERVAQESSIDCALNYRRNHVEGYDGERECNYSKCEYTCDGIKSLVIPENKLDLSTYNIYYNSENVNEISNTIIEFFRTRFIASYKNIVKHVVRNKNYTDFDIISALSTLINNNVVIKNKYGFNSYLQEENRNFFLINNITVKNNIYSEFYISNQIVSKEVDFKELFDEHYEANLSSIIDSISSSKNENDITILINSLPVKIQNMWLEASISAMENNLLKNVFQRDIIFNILKRYAVKINDNTIWVSFMLLKDENILRCSYAGEDGDGFLTWGKCSVESEELFQANKEKEISKLESNVYNFYGIINDADQLQIKDTREVEDTGRYTTNKKKKGMVCGSYSKEVLLNFILNIFKINVVIDRNLDAWLSIEKIYNTKGIDKIREDLVKNKYIGSLNIEDISTLSEDEMKFNLYLLKLSKKDLCDILREFMVNNNLVRKA